MGPKKQQPYIPGLTQRPPESEFPEPVYEENDDDILIREFEKGKKNPTMCLHEYCARNKMTLDFQDEEAEYRPGYTNRYGVRVYVDGLKYRQGVGANKKEAKNDGSRLAFRALVGLDDFEPEEVNPISEEDELLEVRRLKHICEEKDLVYEKSIIQTQEGNYKCTVLVAGLEQISEIHARKLEAVLAAHSKAIMMLGQAPSPHVNSLFEEGAFPTLEKSSRSPNPDLAQERLAKVYEALELKLQTPELGFLTHLDHHIAAFFVCCGQVGVGEPIAVGTGNSSIHAEHIAMNGRCLLDTSCMTVAKRAFRRYLAQEMVSFFKGKGSIFCEARDGSGKLQLTPSTTIHLVLSHPPEGDYQDFLDRPTAQTAENLELIQQGAHIPTFTDDTHGFFKCRNEEEFVEPTQNTPDQKNLSEVKNSNEMRVMTGSDKLLRWNILGIQGAALSLFTHPVYLSSVSIGYNANNDHGHLSRAVCCRVYDELSTELPHPYTINHPVLQFCHREVIPSLSAVYPQQTNLSVNWGDEDDKLEIINGDSGTTHKGSPFMVSSKPNCPSRLCKAGLYFKWFMDVCEAEKKGKKEMFKGKPPRDAKQEATDYQQSKRAFYKHCGQFGVGKWISAPPELDMFIK